MTRAAENLSTKTAGATDTAPLSPGHTPLGDNPLRTRADLQAAVTALLAPLKPHFSPGGARVRLDTRVMTRRWSTCWCLRTPAAGRRATADFR